MLLIAWVDYPLSGSHRARRHTKLPPREDGGVSGRGPENPFGAFVGHRCAR